MHFHFARKITVIFMFTMGLCASFNAAHAFTASTNKTFMGASPDELTQCLGQPTRHLSIHGKNYYIYLTPDGCQTAFVVRNHQVEQILYTTKYVHSHAHDKPVDLNQCPVLRQHCKIK